MTEISWTVLALFGLAVAGYGVFLFIAVPAAGMFVVLIGLALANVGAKKSNSVNRRLVALRKERRKDESRLHADYLRGRPETDRQKIPVGRSYKLLAGFLFVTNLFLISAIIPDFSGGFGREVGSFFSGGLRIVATLFYTALILVLFRSAKSVAVIVLVTWAAIILAAVR